MSIDEILLMHDHSDLEEHRIRALNQAKQALYKDMLELIGEDMPMNYDLMSRSEDQIIRDTCYTQGVNKLRQELRTKLKKYYGVEE